MTYVCCYQYEQFFRTWEFQLPSRYVIFWSIKASILKYELYYEWSMLKTAYDVNISATYSSYQYMILCG